MQVPANPVFGGRLDRLSALIERFRVHAEVFPEGEMEGSASSGSSSTLFVFRGPQGALRLAFLPAPVVKPSFGSDRVAREGESCAVWAKIDIAGVGDHLIAALPECISLELDEVPELAAVVGPLVTEVERPRCGGKAVFHRLCEIVVIRLLRHAMESGAADFGVLAGLSHPRLARALVAVHERPHEKWNLETLAEEAGMSRTQFAITFKDVVGMTPGVYLSNWRLTIARTELEAGGQVSKVARMCGFSSAAAFSRAFSRRFGYTPKMERTKAA